MCKLRNTIHVHKVRFASIYSTGTLENMLYATDCKIRSVIYFLNMRNTIPIQIHHQIFEVYSGNAMMMKLLENWQYSYKTCIEARSWYHLWLI